MVRDESSARSNIILLLLDPMSHVKLPLSLSTSQVNVTFSPAHADLPLNLTSELLKGTEYEIIISKDIYRPIEFVAFRTEAHKTISDIPRPAVKQFILLPASTLRKKNGRVAGGPGHGTSKHALEDV